MLCEFIILNRDAILDATCAKVAQARPQTCGPDSLRKAVPVLLSRLSALVRSAAVGASSRAGDSAVHVDDPLTLGLSVSDVIRVYADICRAVTELAMAQDAPMTVDEFRTLDQALDMAAANAVAEHARFTIHQTTHQETERLCQLVHELRDRINTALLAFSIIRGGTVAVNGSSGALLAHSLTTLRALIESAASELRAAAQPGRESVSTHDRRRNTT